MAMLESDFLKKATAAMPRCAHASWMGPEWVDSCAVSFITWVRALTSLKEDPGKSLSEKQDVYCTCFTGTHCLPLHTNCK